MSIVEFLLKLRNSGVKLRVEGDSLKLQAPKGAVTGELKEEISNRKAEIIEFLKRVDFEARANKDPILPVPRGDGDEIPLTYSQKSMWFYHQLTGGSPVFNISNAVRIKGNIDKGSIIKSLGKLVERHETMRTIFRSVNGSPVQVIQKAEEILLFEMDLRHLSEDQLEVELKRLLKEEARHIFDLEKGPLFKFCLIRLKENEYALSMVIHHIISDAWSNAIFVGEFFKLYELFAQGKEESLPELTVQFADYSQWEQKRLQGDNMNELLDYWKKQLDKPTTLQMPTDRVRPKSQTYEGGFEPVVLSKELAQKLKTLCSSEGTSLFMVILAAFQTLLYRYSGQDDIFTGTVVANRNRREIENVVGFFMNTLVLRTNFTGDPRFRDVLKRVKEMTLDAYSYQELPFDKMLEELKPERDISRTPLFQVMFILHNTKQVELELAGVKMEPIDVESGLAPFDLRLQLTEGEEGIKGGFDYSAALFDADTVKRIAGHLQSILEAICANPDEKVSKIKLLRKDEEEKIFLEFNNTRAYYPTDKVIYQLFEEQAAKNPDSTAVIFGDRELTYRQLNEKSNQLASVLANRGVKTESIVGIMLERSMEMIIGIMAIEKAGGAYLPIDPNYPEDRINYILEDSGVSVLLTSSKFHDMDICGNIQRIFLEDKSLYHGEGNNPVNAASPSNLAYVIYTSGSTGKPKGTLIEHHSLVNRLNWMQKMYPIGSNDTILQKTPFTFDVSVWEMFWWSTQGAKVCFLEPGGEKDPEKILEAIEKNKITVMHFVPSMLSTFLEYLKESGEADRAKGLRQVFASGEALTSAQVRLFNSLLGSNGTRLSNLYGPTEATIDVSYFDCPVEEVPDIIPIGRAIDNTQLLIMDKNMQPQPVGVPGELCIAGVGLARGYLNRPELTAEKFIANSMVPGRRIYRTGDLARWMPDGNIEYLGRMDFQVKLRGLRIELGEIEGVLLLHPSVNECIVTAWEKEPGNVHLVGYIVCDKENPIESGELQAFLGDSLPEYMVPRIFVFLDAMPLSSNGKADRKALPVPVLSKSSGYVAPQNEVEKILSDIWKEELGLKNVGVNDNFFEVGGHSLLLTKIHSRIRKQFDKDFPLVDMFTYSTISSLAKFINGEQEQPSFLKNEDRLKKQKRARQNKFRESDNCETPANESFGGVAIVGMSGRFPGAKNIDEFWENLKNGVDSITSFSKEEAIKAGASEEDVNNPDYVLASGILEDVEYFDASFFGFNPRETENMDPQHRLFLECSYEALENAGYAKNEYEYPVGVYAGSNMSTYFLYHLMAKVGLKDNFGMLLSNDKDYLATRLSYEFNFKGPSINVQTACSTSVTAIALACEGLLNYNCDMALAGGAAVKLPQKLGYLYQPGMIASPDGHARPFDADAQGTIFTSAVGVVVLKRLEDAIADGDNIYAVIKGIAVNNDGSTKVGFTAPSRDGQSEVIVAAQSLAGVNPDDIGYVEAQGTSTSIGDPIEVSALNQVFAQKSQRKNFCALGSVKGNVGHTTSAAGAVAIIKTALALKNKQIPPTVNYKIPNPSIDFENSAFYVNTRLTEWASNGKPRLAGVNSFGFGGTNVHTVLEEAPKIEASTESRTHQLITLSARSKTALDRMSYNLGGFLKENLGLNFADAVYTLHVGRKEFEHRRTLVCRDAQEAADLLVNKNVDSSIYDLNGGTAPSIVFVFTEGKNLKTSTTIDLYNNFEVFRQEFDRGARILESYSGEDPIGILYPEDQLDNTSDRYLSDMRIACSINLIIEYAMAKLWMSWGIKPYTAIGKGTGEYTAALISGVLSLEDALLLAFSDENNLSINLDKVTFSPASSPYVSSVTGTWTDNNEITGREYWAKVSCLDRFDKGIETLEEDNTVLFLQMGIPLHIEGINGAKVFSSLPDEVNSQSEIEAVLYALGKLWEKGSKIRWEEFHNGEKRHRVPLPTYPFERKRYWVEQFNMGEYIKNGSDYCTDNVENAYTRPDLSTEYEAPCNEVEECIAEIWQNLMGIEPVGTKDNFFELGGESLLFVNMHTELEKHYPGRTKVEEIITCPTISEIAAIIGSEGEDGTDNSETESYGYQMYFNDWR
ncbi:hybrid non-ribosomal peptide synthetase/type I polyketide synthase [Acetivibrio cellulolyticus]|uniref:hybrid non-ribosomal peptide synthetase/type I polyketide synthase n=1 Tax=Acetivibrio cellulolyticus TaxID=35830 RepID=UPI0001E300D1|nr:hybrid non-ribosomal peptide synthetase/type I polyketide synthase [Acetivibrio cellulolyticus]